MLRRYRPLLLLLVVAVVLVAGYLLASPSGGSSDPEVPAADLSPGPTTGALIPGPGRTAGPSATAPPASRSVTATPSPSLSNGRDLSLDEARGGHTLSRHVARTDDQLRQRLRAEPDISAASTYTDRATAEEVVQVVLERKKDEIEKWVARSGSRPNLALRFTIGETIGRSMKQGSSTAKNVDAAVVVLRWDGSDWYVLTSYPEERR